MSERYVVHWVDVFGGRFSETPGYEKRVGNEIDYHVHSAHCPLHTGSGSAGSLVIRHEIQKGLWNENRFVGAGLGGATGAIGLK